MRHLLEGGAYFYVDTKRCSAYLRPGTYQGKYGINNLSLILLNLLLDNMAISPEGPLSLQVSITVNVLIQKTMNPI